jgi:hypothetical protein
MIKEKYKQLCLARRFGGINTIEYTQTLYAMLKKPTVQIAHLFFADTQAKAEKTNVLFCCQTYIN